MARTADNNMVLVREWGSIEYAVRSSGKMPAREFIEGLDIRERIKLETLLERMAKCGEIRNKEKFRHLVGKIYEFKSDNNRVLCFQSRKSWVLTNGFKKEKDKTPRREISRAKNIMIEYLER